MFGKIKDWFGIEGAKMRLNVLEVYPKEVETLNGEVVFTAIRRQKITFVRIKLIERYTRGRGDSKKVDEYELGKWVFDEPFEVSKDNPKTILFKMPFERLLSKMDKRQETSILGVFAGFAKTLRGVYSEYRVEAEAIVENVNFTISDKKAIQFQ